MPLQDELAKAAQFIAQTAQCDKIKGLVVLGSGLGDFAETLTNVRFVDYADIPNFHKPTIEGHAGRLAIGDIAEGFTIACMQGRFHYYEGHDMNTVVFPTRVLRQLGAEFLLVTNAAGGINPSFKPGTLMLIEDHINMMGDNPLIGPNHEFLGPRFPDMTEAYHPELRALAKAVAAEQGIELQGGVYIGLRGPTYETPAEVRMLKALGADAVGMSTVPEVIAANHMGMKVLGISCVTNQAAGLSGHKLSHQEVMETAEHTKARFVNLLTGILKRLATQPVESCQVVSP